MGDADLMAFMAEIDSIEKKNKKQKSTKKRNVVEVRFFFYKISLSLSLTQYFYTVSRDFITHSSNTHEIKNEQQTKAYQRKIKEINGNQKKIKIASFSAK